MLPRAHRLRASQDIQAVVRRGRCLTTPAVRVCALPREASGSRVACVVGKRVHRHAVVRHRYQRQLRVLARRVLDRLPSNEAYDMVWVAQPGIGRSGDWQKVTAELVPRVVSFLASLQS